MTIAGLLLGIGWALTMGALLLSGEFGALHNLDRLRLNLIAGAALATVFALLFTWEYRHQPAPPLTLREIRETVRAAVPPPLPPPDPFAQNTGKLSYKEGALLLSLANDFAATALQIGNPGVVFLGRPSAIPQISFGDNSLIVMSNGNKLEVSTKIRDMKGNMVAEIINNEWKISPPPGNWDRNYNDDTLEVIGEKGWVILQVRLVPGIIQMQWEWWRADGTGVRFVDTYDPRHPGMLSLQMNADNLPAFPEIKPIFKYPSASHLGELAD